MKIIIATNEINAVNERFTEECLEEMGKTKNLPIYDSFLREKQIGKLLDCEYDNGNLFGNILLNSV